MRRGLNASCLKLLIFDMLALVNGGLFQSHIICGKKEYLWQSLLNEAGWYAGLCRFLEWRITGCKNFSAGMVVLLWWILWNMESLATFLQFSKLLNLDGMYLFIALLIPSLNCDQSSLADLLTLMMLLVRSSLSGHFSSN